MKGIHCESFLVSHKRNNFCTWVPFDVSLRVAVPSPPVFSSTGGGGTAMRRLFDVDILLIIHCSIVVLGSQGHVKNIIFVHGWTIPMDLVNGHLHALHHLLS